MDQMLRPKAVVLSAAALIPDRNQVLPAPNQFSHMLKSRQPYFYSFAHECKVASGFFAMGTKLLLLFHDGGAMCRVLDAQGLYVSTEFKGLRRIKTRLRPAREP
jgi:hypothetical protein